MPEQNFQNHSRYVPLYHFITPTLIVAAIGGSVVNVVHTYHSGNGHYSAALICLLSIVALFLWWFCRVFALKAQDRAIRAEENFRHFVATGTLLDGRLRMSQIVALRFAGDDEFVSLVKKAVGENLSSKQIKMAIKNWKADNNRA